MNRGRKNKTQKIIIITMILVLVLSLILSYGSIKYKSEQKMAQNQVPFILIPGTGANGDRFDSFMNKLMKKVGKEMSWKLMLRPMVLHNIHLRWLKI